MKKVIIFIFLMLFLINNVFAADVAYLLKYRANAQENVLEAFRAMNLTVDLIEDKNVPRTDLTKYKLVFVDDARMRNTEKLTISDYPSVIMNNIYGLEWGLTEDFEIRNAGATSPLEVLVNGRLQQIYTRAYYLDQSLAIPYYYIADDDSEDYYKTSIARTDGDQQHAILPGDVIATMPIGTRFYNGKVSKAKMCYYGIPKTDYWTNNAKELFIDCVGSILIKCNNNAECNDNNLSTEDICRNPRTVNSYCDHVPIKCFRNSDCGNERASGGLYCAGKNVTQDYIVPYCTNPGTSSSFCSERTESRRNQTCDYACELGRCFKPCYNDTDCDDTNRYTIDHCNLPGTIRSFCSYENITCWENPDCNDNKTNTQDICHRPGTALSYCTNNDITCFRNSDCGTDIDVGNFYCNGASGKDVYKNYQTWICDKPGTENSSCDSSVSPKLREMCSDICLEGTCYDVRCYNNTDCNDRNINTSDICHNPGQPSSYCTNSNIRCFTDADCGYNRFIGQVYCKGDDLGRDYLRFICNNKGTDASYCSTRIASNLSYDCDYRCANGNCVRCNDNSDCNDSNIWTQDTCWFSGTTDSYCTNEHIECYNDLDCGINGYVGLPYCTNDDRYQDYRVFTCVNKGETGSYCSAANNPLLKENCSFGCSDGNCILCVDNDHDGYNATGGICGIIDCNDNNANIHPGATEMCNSADDDCDESIDEGFNVGGNCSNGIGSCLRYGSFVCNAYGNGTTCNAVAGQPSYEICNRLDDDCDGAVDEGISCVACYNNSQCGGLKYANICYGNFSFDLTTTPICLSPGEYNSSCMNITTNTSSLCDNGCNISSGECNNKTSIHDVEIMLELNMSVNGIKITDANGTIIEDDIAELNQNDSYNIAFRIRNKGNFDENLVFKGISCVNWTPITTSLDIGEEKTKNNNIKFNCAPGLYNMTITANLTNATDANPSDNIRYRTIRILPKSECLTDEDCLLLEDEFCSGNNIISVVGRCVDRVCTTQPQLQENCSLRNGIEGCAYTEWSCVKPQNVPYCDVINKTAQDNLCSDYCNGETLKEGYCNSTTYLCNYVSTDCNINNNWQDDGAKRWINDTICTEKEQKEQEYRDYYCDESEEGNNIEIYSLTAYKTNGWSDIANAGDNDWNTYAWTTSPNKLLFVNISLSNVLSANWSYKYEQLTSSQWMGFACYDYSTSNWHAIHSQPSSIFETRNDVIFSGCISEGKPIQLSINSNWNSRYYEGKIIVSIYSDSVECDYDITGTQWVNTSNITNKPNGTSCEDGAYCNGAETCFGGQCKLGVPLNCNDSISCTADSCNETTRSCNNKPNDNLCSDGLYCNGAEKCYTLSGCGPSVAIDCSGNNLNLISTCFNIPDGIDFTYDYRAAYVSACNETSDSCSNGNQIVITHTCNVNSCGAECDATRSCSATDCDNLDRCVGRDYYNYSDVSNSCLGNCSCTSNSCGVPVIIPNYPGCGECSNDDDCNGLDRNYCNGSILKHDEGKCINNVCSAVKINETNCNDGLYCNGAESCSADRCVSGISINCSMNNICGVNSCFNIPDGIDFTYDYRKSFASLCNETSDSCTTGITSIQHTCDIARCGAVCEDNSDCLATDCDYLDGCKGPNNRDYYDYNDVNNDCLISSCSCTQKSCSEPNIRYNDPRCYVPVCGNGIVDSGEECDDGNLVNGDGCHRDCTTEEICHYPCNPHDCNCRQVCRFGQCWSVCDTCYDTCQRYC